MLIDASTRLRSASVLVRIGDAMDIYIYIYRVSSSFKCTAPPHCSRAKVHFGHVLPLCSPLFPRAPSLLTRASAQSLSPLLLFCAPSLLPLKRPCSLSQLKTAISNLRFEMYIIDTYQQGNVNDEEQVTTIPIFREIKNILLNTQEGKSCNLSIEGSLSTQRIPSVLTLLILPQRARQWKQ